MVQGIRVLSMVVVTSVMIGCGGRSGNSAGVVSLAPLDHVSAVRGFMDAIKTEDLTTMAGLWGTRDGVAARDMDREELIRRLTVIMTYLAHDEYELIERANALMSTRDQRSVTVRVWRVGCISDVPFTVVWAGDGWLVQAMDLEAVVTPRQPCRR